MDSFDLYFEVGDGVAISAERSRPDFGVPSVAPRGWVGSAGPAIDPETWPRGPLTGLPMFHGLTLRLPEEYQRRGPGLPGIAFFQGEGQFAEQPPEVEPSDPFHQQLAAHRTHPRLGLRSDIIDGRFALLWLNEAELAGGPTQPPVDSRRPGEHRPDDEGPNAWDTVEATRRVWLAVRADPNSGLAPTERTEPPSGYQQPYDPAARGWHPWAAPLPGRSHLGGTSFCVQALPEGLTPYYLELEELPGLNFGGGNAQIDLESEIFDWAC